MSAAGGAAVGGYVVLERGGSLWGVAGHQVRGLGRLAAAGGAPPVGDGLGDGAASAAVLEGLRLQVPGGALAADRVLAVVPDLRVWPAPGALVRFWSASAVGLAVYAERPVLVIDGERPPDLLRAPAEPGDGGD